MTWFKARMLNWPGAPPDEADRRPSDCLCHARAFRHSESCFDMLPRVEIAAQISEILSFLKKFGYELSLVF
jgi:hypothetical protein